MSTYTYETQVDPPQPEDIVTEIRVVRIPEGRGRPMFLTPRRFVRVCQYIEKGESATAACNLEFVSYPSFRAHVRQRPSYARRLKKAEEVRENLLREFHIANVKKHAEKSVAASMFWLERRFPNEFALRTVVRNTGESGESAVFNKIPFEQLVENARLAAEIAAKPPSGLAAPPPGLPEGAREDEREATEKQFTSNQG
jgi:hypothetical protein